MFNRALRRGYEKVSLKPVPYILSTFYCTLLSIGALLAPIGAALLIFYMLSFIGISLSGYSIIFYGLAGIFFLVSVLLLSAFKGALVRSYYEPFRNIIEYIKYSINNGLPYIGVSIIKIILHSIFNLPLLYIYFTFVPDFAIILFALINLPFIFLIELLFSFSYISIAVRNKTSIAAIMDSIDKVRKNAVDVLPAYILYGFVSLARVIPLLNLFIHFVLYPIVYRVMIEIYTY